MTPADITDRLKVIRDTAEDEFTHDTVDAAIARIAELEGALERLVAVRDTQRKRESGEFHIPPDSFMAMWDEAEDQAQAALAAKEAT